MVGVQRHFLMGFTQSCVMRLFIALHTSARKRYFASVITQVVCTTGEQDRWAIVSFMYWYQHC
jgi:hypothetical protein